MIFYKQFGKKLNAKQIKTVTGFLFDHCMSICQHNENCKSFNFNHGKPSIPRRCVFFAHDACSREVTLIDDPSIDYFDTNNGKCRQGG